MSRSERKRYRQYLQPDSDAQVPRQTLQYVLKRKKGSTPADQVNLSSQSVEDDSAQYQDDAAENSGPAHTNLASDVNVGASTSARASGEERDSDEGTIKIDDTYDDSSNSSDEFTSAFELSGDRLEEEEVCDDADSEPEDSPQDTESDCLGQDDFNGYFAKLSEEHLPHQATTKAQALLLVLAYVVTSGLTWTQVQGLLILINALFGEQVVPSSTYAVRKLWKSRKEALRIHLYCQACHGYLGKHCDARGNDKIICASCGQEKKVRHLMSTGSFFLIFDIRQQLVGLLKQVGSTLLSNLRKVSSAHHVPGVYSDITDGLLYRSIRKQIGMAWSDITLCFNTDGAPVFDSSKSSIWPLQISINELPVLTRWQNIMISGVWFSNVHPPMHLLMKKFVEEVNDIGKIVWSCSGSIIRSAVHAVVCCVDSPARAVILNRKQYNGYFGCSWCLDQGVTIDGTMKYPFNGNNTPDRTHSGVLKAMGQAGHRKEPVQGIKGPSTLVKLQGLDLVWGLPPDYMHCVLEGVTKQVTELWLSCSGSAWYIGRHMKLINGRLCSMRPPITFARSGRPLSDRAYWKAAEWRSWLLFYCLPCVSDVLPRSYASHFALLVKAVFLLLKDVVMEAEVCTAESLLVTFVQQTGKLYGQSTMTFNVHQLLHLSKAVRMFGPLWGTSTFPFEDGIGKALQLVTAAKHVPVQIAERCIMHQAYRTVCAQIEVPSCLLSAKKQLEHTYKRCSQTCTLGQAQPTSEVAENLRSLFMGKLGRVPRLLKYFRCQVGTIVVHSSEYSVPKKTCSSYLKMSDGTHCHVFAIYLALGTIYLHCQQLVTAQSIFDVPHILQCHHPPAHESHVLHGIEDVSAQCIFFNVGNISYLCELPNKFEKN